MRIMEVVHIVAYRILASSVVVKVPVGGAVLNARSLLFGWIIFVALCVALLVAQHTAISVSTFTPQTVTMRPIAGAGWVRSATDLLCHHR